MSTYDISLIIPAFNAAKYLGEAIDSALRQTTTPAQIIVVDDGSTDGTGDVARSFGDRVILTHQANAGPSAARNRGLAMATCPLVSFLDGDDLLDPHKLERQVERLRGTPDAMLCICRVVNFWTPELAAQHQADPAFEPAFVPGQVTSWLARRDLFDRIGTFRADRAFTHAEGSELFTRVEDSGLPIVRLDDALVRRRLHGSNMTANREAHLDSILALVKHRVNRGRRPVC